MGGRGRGRGGGRGGERDDAPRAMRAPIGEDDGPRLRLAEPEFQPEWLSGKAEWAVAVRETARVMELFHSKSFAKRFHVANALPSVEWFREAKAGLESAYLQKVEYIDEQAAALRAQLEDATISETRKSVIPSHIQNIQKKLDEEDAQVREMSADLDEVAEAVERLPKEIAAAVQELKRQKEIHVARLSRDPHYGIECIEEAMTFLQERALISQQPPITSTMSTSKRGNVRCWTHIHRIGTASCDSSVPVTIVREPEVYIHSSTSSLPVVSSTGISSRVGEFIQQLSHHIGTPTPPKTGQVLQATYPNLATGLGVCTFFKPDGCVCYYFIGSERGSTGQPIIKSWHTEPTFTEEFIRSSCACDLYQRHVSNSAVNESQLFCASIQVALTALKRCLPPPSTFDVVDETTIPNNSVPSDSSNRKRARQDVSQQMSTA